MAVNSRPLKGNNKAAEKIASLVDMDVDLRFGGRKEGGGQSLTGFCPGGKMAQVGRGYSQPL